MARFNALMKRHNLKLELEEAIQERGDWRAAQICATIANFASKNKKKSYKAKDFMPKKGVKKGIYNTWKKQLSLVEILNEAFGGKDLRKKGG